MVTKSSKFTLALNNLTMNISIPKVDPAAGGGSGENMGSDLGFAGQC